MGKRLHLLENSSSPSGRISKLPSTILWAWERPEKLDYIDPQKTGIAFLAKTIYLRADRIVSRPRLQPLAVPGGAQVIAVARIESERSQPPTLSTQQVDDVAVEISELASLPNVVMVQVDFDAKASERSFFLSFYADRTKNEAPAVDPTFNYGPGLLVQGRQLVGRPGCR